MNNEIERRVQFWTHWTGSEMANRTNKQNRTFSRSCSVCSSSAPHRTEPNNTLVRFVFGRISNIDNLVRFCSVLFELLKQKSSTRYSSVSCASVTEADDVMGRRRHGMTLSRNDAVTLLIIGCLRMSHLKSILLVCTVWVMDMTHTLGLCI